MLYIRDVVRFEDVRDRRIIGIVQEAAVLIDLDAKKTCISRQSLADLISRVEAGSAALLVDHDYDRLKPDGTVSTKQKERQRKLWALVGPVLEQLPAIFDRAARGHAVARRAAETQANAKTIHEALHRYWQGGMTGHALCPQFDACGVRGPRSRGKMKLGRPPKGDKKPGVNITPEIEEAFDKGVTRYYKRCPVATLAQAFERILVDLSVEHVLDQETGMIELRTVAFFKEHGLPTIRQFRYWYQKSGRVLRDKKARMGASKYEKDNRVLLGSSTEHNLNIGGRYQIDATDMNVCCVSDLNRSILVGRPVLYLVTDEFSRLIVGYYIGFEEPSWVAAMVALNSTVADKVELCAKLGIHIDDDDWPTAGFYPMRTLWDRGEAKGQLAEGFALKSGVTVENTSPGRGDLKGIVEQRFDLLDELIRCDVRGYVAKDQGERGTKDYRRDAVLTLNSLQRIIVHAILFLNNRELTGYPLTKPMIAAGVRTAPLDIWRWCAASGRSNLRRTTELEAMLDLLPMEPVSISREGFRFKGLWYECSRGLAEDWFEMAQVAGHKGQLMASYHPLLTDFIYLHVADADPVEVCGLTARSASYAGLSFKEVTEIRAHRSAVRNHRQTDDVLEHAYLRMQIDLIVSEDVALNPGRHSRGAVAGIRDNRAVERLVGQQALRQQALEFAAAVFEDDGAGAVIENMPSSSFPLGWGDAD